MRGSYLSTLDAATGSDDLAAPEPTCFAMGFMWTSPCVERRQVFISSLVISRGRELIVDFTGERHFS